MRGFVRECVEQMKGYVPGEQPDDPAIIKLNTNENPYPPSPRALAAYRSFDPAELRLYSEPMSLALRKALAARLEVGVDQIFIGNGSDEVLALCTRAFVENDGSIGYFDPSYSLYPVLSDIRGVEQRPVPLTDDFRWQMPDDYAASLFLLTNPNAPTGMAHPQKLIEGFCRDFDGVVVVDEAYGDFAAEDALALAKENAARLELEIEFFHGDLFEALPKSIYGRIDLLVSNPPYIEEKDWEALPADVRDHEPRTALISGPDGTEILERIADDAYWWLGVGGWVLCEIGETQGRRVDEMFGQWLDTEVRPDLTGRDRMIVGRKGARCCV